MKLNINSADLGYTIDTYQMFPMDSEESTLEWLNEEEQLLENGRTAEDEITYDDVEWEYDHKGYVKYLAEKSIEILEGEFVDPHDEESIVKSITYVRSGSPKFYNFSTDWYLAEWDVDVEQLDNYILSEGGFEDFISERWQYEWDKAREENDLETQVVVKLDFYTRNEFSDEQYHDSMYEVYGEGAYEFTEYTVKPKEA